MKKSKQEPDYRRNAVASRDVVQQEFQKLRDEKDRAEKKKRKWKKICQSQADSLEALENEVAQGKKKLEQEKKESAKRELHAKIQAHLDALNFYREGTRGT